MKVLSIAHSESGGGIQSVFRVNNSIRNSNIEMVTAFQSDKYSIAKIELIHLSSIKNPLLIILGYFFIPKNYFSIRNFLAKSRVDIVHLHGSVGLSLGALIAIKKYKRNAKIVLSAHGYGLICPNYSCYNYTENKICNKCVFMGHESRIIMDKCDKRGLHYSVLRYIDFRLRKAIAVDYSLYDLIITPSEYSHKLHTRSRHSFNRIETVPNPVEGKSLKFDSEAKEDIIVFAGRFSQEKNIPLLVEAFNHLVHCNQQKEIQLFIIGSGRQRSMILKQIDDFDIGNQVFLSEEYLSQKELYGYFKKAKILVLPTTMAETFGLVLFEGVKHNMVPICKNIGAQAENIRNLGVGYLYNEDNPILLAETILNAFKTYNSKEKQFRIANQIIEDNYSDAIYKEKIIAYYDEVQAR